MNQLQPYRRPYITRTKHIATRLEITISLAMTLRSVMQLHTALVTVVPAQFLINLFVLWNGKSHRPNAR